MKIIKVKALTWKKEPIINCLSEALLFSKRNMLLLAGFPIVGCIAGEKLKKSLNPICQSLLG